MAETDSDVGDLLERITRAVRAVVGEDGPFDSEIAAAAARKEVDAIRADTGVEFVLECVDGRYSLVVPFGIKIS